MLYIVRSSFENLQYLNIPVGFHRKNANASPDLEDASAKGRDKISLCFILYILVNCVLNIHRNCLKITICCGLSAVESSTFEVGQRGMNLCKCFHDILMNQ